MAQGQYKEALESFIAAKQLVSETSPYIDQSVALGLLENGRFSEAIAQAQLAIAEWPAEGGRDAEVPLLVLIAAESEDGKTAEAHTDLRRFLATPRTYRSIEEFRKNPQFAAAPKLLEGLRRAGMPEE
jgi:hypothetical protein